MDFARPRKVFCVFGLRRDANQTRTHPPRRAGSGRPSTSRLYAFKKRMTRSKEILDGRRRARPKALLRQEEIAALLLSAAAQAERLCPEENGVLEILRTPGGFLVGEQGTRIDIERRHPTAPFRFESHPNPRRPGIRESNAVDLVHQVELLILSRMEFTPEFEPAVRQSERDMAEGTAARAREPGSE